MKARVISGVVGIALFIVLCFAGQIPFAIAVTVIAAIAASEFVTAQKRANPPADVPAGIRGLATLMRPINALLTACGVVMIPVADYVTRHGMLQMEKVYLAVLVLGVACGMGFVFKAWRSGTLLGWYRAFYGKAGFWYLALFSSFVLLRAAYGTIRVGSFPEADRGAWLMLLVAVCVWATDTFAFFTGKAIGKHKLAPKLSPAKTIEGFLGGLIGAVAVGALFAHWITLPWMNGAVVGMIAGILGPMGDLFESGLKRELGIKDFGAIMPGHGGVLDRFDSLLFVAPVACLYLLLSGNLTRVFKL